MDVCFVILHYKEIQATFSCIESIEALNRPDGCSVKTVVVDNGSRNGSGERLRDFYRENPSVDIVVSEENLGFARGNNLGANYYFGLYGYPDYLIACNNDTVVSDPDFLFKVGKLHAIHGFNVFGPDIYNPRTHEHQSPCDEGVVAIETVDRMIDDCKKQLAVYQFPNMLQKVKLAIKDSSFFRACAVAKHRLGIFEKGRKWNETQEGVVLHGSFLVFDHAYLRKMPWLFSPATFMYFEEFFLHYCAMQNDLKLLYCPEVQILHLHGVSTSANRPKWSQRQLFYYENLLDSLVEYRKLF